MKIIFLFLFSAFFSKNVFSQTSDSIAIVKILEKESVTWRLGDSTAHASCWQKEPYGTVTVITKDGKTFSFPSEKIIHPSTGMMGKGGVSKNSNYKMSIHRNTALVTHNETSTTVSGTVSHTFEVRILEKINGDWKLTGQIIQVL